MKYQVEKYQEELIALNEAIWTAAETSFEEFVSVKAMTQLLKKYGFQIEEGIGGIETAFKATYGSGTPAIGLLAEYDALDGLSQQGGCFEKRPREETTKGHGCGHNLLGTGVVAAALDLKEYLDVNPEAGTVILYGCPAEESGGGKTLMAGAGVFDEIDVALTWHPCTINASMGCRMLSTCQAAFHFHGVSSHAANAPQRGRSALDAVELMNVGVNYLREHMEMSDRVHYAILNAGGTAPNVIPSEASVIHMVRSETNRRTKELYQRVCDIARGAALMTGTTVDIEFRGGCSNVVPNQVLGELAYDIMVGLGAPKYTKEEEAYVKRFHEIVGEKAVLEDDGAVPHYDMELRRALVKTHPMADFVLPYKMVSDVQTASSDMGDVSQVVPLIQIQTACFTQGSQAHSWLWVSQGVSTYAMKGTLYAGQVMADMGKALFEDHELIENAKAEYRSRMEGVPYECPIPEEWRGKIKLRK